MDLFLIDTHAHIYLPEFDEDRSEMVKRARNAGVKRILMPAIDAKTHDAMFRVEAEFPEAQSMIGVHPCSVNETFEEELKLVCNLLEQRRFVAIGEIGLDFYWDKQHMEYQHVAFERQVKLALDHDLPIVIHSRSALDECINVVSKFPGLKGVFHCFSGSAHQARQIMELGFYLGIGGVATFKNAGLDKVLSATGLERVVLETDAPYLAPVPFRGKRNESSYLEHIVKKLQETSGMTEEEITELTSANAEKLFNLY